MTALVFALLLDAFLLANFYWTDFITVTQRNMLLAALFGAWLVLLFVASFFKRQLLAVPGAKDKDELYRKAITFYLRGLWHETESLIAPLLHKNPKDVDFLLLQATLYRHTQRHAEAVAVLDKLQLCDGSERWLWEIDNERLLIDEELARIQEPPADDQGVSTPSCPFD